MSSHFLLLKMEDRTSTGNEDHQTSSCKLTNCQEGGPATDSSCKVQVDGESEYPLTKPEDNVTFHQRSSSNNVQPEEGDSENAFVRVAHCDGGSLEDLMDYRSSSFNAVTHCMCCEETESGPAAESESRDISFVSFQGKQAVRPRTPLEASQSLPTVLPLLHSHTQTRHSQPNASLRDDVRLSPHDASTSHPSTDPRLLRVSGVVSDSMLSLPNGDICRICHAGRRHEPLISPCVCSGSVKYTHQRCLSTWLAESGLSRCELCGFKYKTKMVGSINICQWKALRLSLLDKLHLVVFSLSIFLLAGTALYIAWAAVNYSSQASTGLDPDSLASQILLPVYSTLSFVSLGIVIFEGKNTCLRLLRRWRALNMGLQIMEREPEVDVDADFSCQRALDRQGEPLTSVTPSARGLCDLATGEEDLPNLDCWTMWSETKAEDPRPSNLLLI